MRISFCFKRSVYFLAAIIIIFSTTATAETLPKDLQRISQHGSIKVALYFEDIPPFFQKKDNQWEGFDIDISRRIADKLGVKVEFIPKAKTFDELVQMVAHRNADIAISVLSQTLERARYVRFSEPYLQLNQALMINRLLAVRKKLGKNILGGMNKKEIRIGVIRGSSYVSFANDIFPKATIVQYDHWDDIINDVLKENLFAAFYDSIEVKNFLSKNKTANLYIQTVILKDNVDNISVAVHSDDTHLLAWLNLFIKSLKERGILSQLRNKYL